MRNKTGRWVIGVTGASGMRYAQRLLRALANSGIELHVVVSEAGLRVLHEEEGIKLSQSSLSTEALFGERYDRCTFYNSKDIGAAIASGSMLFDGMVIVPCSMGTLAAVASGFSQNLLHRAADVTLKEGRELIMVPRETPLSQIHLENMLKLSRMGVAMLPAMPGFYHQPLTIDDLVDQLVMKIMDRMGIANSLVERWGEKKPFELTQVVSTGNLEFKPTLKVVELRKN